MKEGNAMDTTPVTRPEYDEFKRRVDDSQKRTSERLRILEESSNRLTDLCVAVEKLATNMKHMVEEQKEQGAKLEKLEGKDGEMWRKVVGHVTTVVIGILVGYVFTKMGM